MMKIKQKIIKQNKKGGEKRKTEGCSFFHVYLCGNCYALDDVCQKLIHNIALKKTVPDEMAKKKLLRINVLVILLLKTLSLEQT